MTTAQMKSISSSHDRKETTMDNIWHKPSELCPEYDETVIVVLKTGEAKAAYYQADEVEDFWIDVNARFWEDFPEEISPDQIEKWCYTNDLVHAQLTKGTM